MFGQVGALGINIIPKRLKEKTQIISTKYSYRKISVFYKKNYK